ncbi:ATP-binding cassette domain-containing protein [Chitinophaga qingshengii]|uniref:UvrABC system protein A n=1 Tax=Chitinophaga qingshengii TaxID=1569794 RepID=A0ABR7TQP6_9BACT|nr:excinuclease ABC subunit UvrA [Chitinophaga qingshengii]MBC9932809.1 excinuclease ABC subunit UvrA [Chitinophaga qingshengii]
MHPIKITGARQHNLKNLTVTIPKNTITVFTGISGSGKSSLVFKTIGAEAHRQMSEMQHSFVRSRMEHLGVPDVDSIEHLNVPVIINQKRLGGNVRSTVGTATDIYTSLRLLFSRIGQPFVGYANIFSFNHPQGMCPVCSGIGQTRQVDTDRLIDKNKSLNEGAIRFPTFQPGGYRWLRYAESGYFDNDKKLADYTPEEWQMLLYAEEHVPPNPSSKWGKTVRYTGIIPRLERDILKKDSKEQRMREKEIGQVVGEQICPSCHGKRLNEKVLSCKINGLDIAGCAAMPVDELLAFIRPIQAPGYETVLAELVKKLQHMITIGLSYLTLDRVTATLSGGESQRIKMVRHLDSSLENLLYIFDEPSIGLHPKDLDNISRIIQKIRDKGNTVLLVEHDPDLIRIADHVIDMGPGSGAHGGEIIYQGSFDGLRSSNGKTGQYFARQKSYNQHPRPFTETIPIHNAALHNLQHVTIRIPQRIMTVVTGVAGSGKSTLISEVLPAQYPELTLIDQSPIAGHSKSNLLTYLSISDTVRNLFAHANGVSNSLFSRNSEGGCPNCKGVGVEKIDLAFMDDVEVPCEVCGGSGFRPEVLQYRYQQKNIAGVMQLTVEEATQFFAAQKDLNKSFALLHDLGMGYLTLGQRLDSFSGGELQRLKLCTQMKHWYPVIVLDEPSTGLHPADTEKLLAWLHKLVQKGHTLIVIEHNLDIIACADWIIDMGPGAGKDGGRLVFEGTVPDLLQNKASATATYLRKYLTP